MLVFSFLVTSKGIKKLHLGLILLQILTFDLQQALKKTFGKAPLKILKGPNLDKKQLV
jgi:hypothetical protein